MKKYTLLLVIIVMVACFTSCKSRQQIIRFDARVSDKSATELFSDVVANQFPFNTLSARLNVNLSMGTNSASSRAQIRMIHNGAIQLSVQPILGIEMLRIYIDPETVIIVDRMNRRYVEESITALREIYPIGFDFHSLQSLLTNSLFVTGKSSVEPRDYRTFTFAQTDDMHYSISAHDRRSGIEYSFTINGDDRITQANLTKRPNVLQWDYSNFMMVNGHIFPHQMNVALGTASRRATADITFSNITTNESFQLAPNIPSGFTRTSMSEIIRIISTLL